MKDIFKFLKTGVLETKGKQSFIFILAVFILFIYALNFVFDISFKLLVQAGYSQLPIKDVGESQKILSHFYASVFVGPILEELGFRLPLKKLKLSIPLFFSITWFYASKAFSIPIFESAMFAIMIFAGLLILLSVNRLKEPVTTFYRAYPRAILYFLAIVFSILHLFNYQLASLYFWSVLFKILPLFLSALLFSYIRVRFSLIHSIFMHMLINAIPFAIQQVIQ